MTATERAKAVEAAMDRAERMCSSRDRNAATVLQQLETLAGRLETEATSAADRDQARWKALAETLKARAEP